MEMIFEDKTIEIENHIQHVVIGNSYEYSRKITKHYAKSFYFAAQLLPLHKRKATYALYGFCRYTDNLVDNFYYLSENELRYKLQAWRFDLDLALLQNYSHNPVLNAFVNVVSNYNLNTKHAYELIEGVEMDISKNRYTTYKDLQIFCYKVASVVGLMMTEILGYSDDKALTHAAELGEAMQITNILRDINEDLEIGRIYIPEDLMTKHNYTETDLNNRTVNENFIRLIEELMQKAESLYKSAELGISMLEKNSRFSIIAASRIYSDILLQIRKNKYDVFSKRAMVSKKKKIYILLKEYIKNLV